MELRPAKRKKCSPPKNLLFLPKNKTSIFIAYFDGFSVFVKDPQNILDLHNSGFYGKGNLSKSIPTFNSHNEGFLEVLTYQQWELRNCYATHVNKAASTEIRKHLLAEASTKEFLNRSKEGTCSSWRQLKNSVNEKLRSEHTYIWPEDCLSDRDALHSDILTDLVNEIHSTGTPRKTPEIYLNTIDKVLVVGGASGPRLLERPPPQNEVLQLSHDEAYFLALAGRLLVQDLHGKPIENLKLWNLFQELDDNFITRYAVYHWYRTKGWVVRCGLKYGGDFILYENGPPYCHSSYVVHVMNDNSFDWQKLIMQQRLVESSNKDLIFCHVISPPNLKEERRNPEVLSKFLIKEVLQRRWIPSQQRIGK